MSSTERQKLVANNLINLRCIHWMPQSSKWLQMKLHRARFVIEMRCIWDDVVRREFFEASFNLFVSFVCGFFFCSSLRVVRANYKFFFSFFFFKFNGKMWTNFKRKEKKDRIPIMLISFSVRAIHVFFFLFTSNEHNDLITSIENLAPVFSSYSQFKSTSHCLKLVASYSFNWLTTDELITELFWFEEFAQIKLENVAETTSVYIIKRMCDLICNRWFA